jgi:hypothetical protein
MRFSMSRKIAALICVGFAWAACTPAVFADPPAFIMLSHPQVFGSLSRPAVRFTHGDHALQGVTCLTCHHVGNPATLCATCHARPRDLEMSFHRLCISCHDTAKAQGKVTGPRACGDCHTLSR